MGKNEKEKKILSQFMCTIKSNWHKPNPWGGSFALLTKKNEAQITNCVLPQPESWLYWLLFSAFRYCYVACVFFFKITTLGGEQRKGCRGGVHILGDMRFLCQQQNQLQTTQRWFAGEQREKTAESFLTSSCSSSGTSSPWGCCCQREEGSWWP